MTMLIRGSAPLVIAAVLSAGLTAEAQVSIGGSLQQKPEQRIASSAARMENPPKLSDGHPDLQGFWSNQSVTTLTRPASIPKLVLTPEEAAKYEAQFVWNVNEQNQRADVDVNKPPPGGSGAEFATTGYNSFWLDHGRHYAVVKGEIRSSWLTEPADGRLPLKPGAGRGGGADAYGTFDGPETRPLAERCIVSYSRSSGPVMQNSLYNNNYQIVQSPNAVLIDVEMNHDARIVPLVKSKADVRHTAGAIQPWFGDSIGWYEGDTLVVETVNVTPKQRSQMSPSGKLTERFTRWSPTEILYEFTVEDPEMYTATWKGEEILHASKEPVYEYACHEGNYALTDILAGARLQESQGKVVGRNTEVER